MNIDNSFRKLTAIFAITAGVLALLSLVVGLSGVNYDFEVFSDTSSLIAAGSTAGNAIRWSYWFNMLGNYLLLIPLALLLFQWLKSVNSSFAELYTLSGLIYLILGATGSAILAATWPFLIDQFEVASTAAREFLVIEFQVVNAIAEKGLHGVLQNLAGAIWFLGIGYLLRSKHMGVGNFAFAIGVFLVLNTVGNVFNIEALSLLGLTANILLGPIWSILIGIFLIKGNLE
ncbi:DUF4386 family protein [Thalassotalea psychrophila]|uniref:DUF4386 family protein n=1 Tax=Thalassotalea psychrophila TaxID=3065647 RepID=A0ABY9TVF7_9GAMM|nr:DUF4386 family protein [Colwelliaceae bacterium SQ149]